MGAVFGRFIEVHFLEGGVPTLKKLREDRAASHLRLGGRLGGAIFGFYRQRVGVSQNVLFPTTHRVQLVQLVQLKKSREGTSTTQWTSMGSMTCWIHSTLLGQHQCSVSLHQHQYSVSQCRHQCNVRRHLCPQSQHREARSAARKTARVVDDLARVAKAAEAKLLVGLLGLQPGHRTQRGHRHRSAHRETNKVCQCDG